MSYYDALLKCRELSFGTLFQGISSQDVEQAIVSDESHPERLLALLSPAAVPFLEPMAQKAHEITLKQFGRTIQLYTPMYLSNFCTNRCTYCGFNMSHSLPRRKLTLEEVEKEAAFIASTEIEHILVLTGDSRTDSPVSYIKESIRLLKKHFSSISVEIYALTEAEYAELVLEGVDGVTLYQETYDEAVYERVHLAGPKKNYRFRLEAPERAARSGMRTVNIGALLGLNDWRKEVLWMGLHAQYLQDRFPEVEIGASVPRLRPHTGAFSVPCEVRDQDLVQIVTALRLFLPRLGLAISTRESSTLRDHLLPLGITRMSAGSTTRVGGHTLDRIRDENTPQFEIADPRDVEAVKAMLTQKGYQPVFKDWMPL